MGLVLPLNIFRLTLQYKGTQYLGFQVQSIGQTIQGELNRALRVISKSEEVKSIGSGRTDAGVHAHGQIVRIEIPLEIATDSLVRAINSHLPYDIRVIDASCCTTDFHPIYSAHSKEYNYVFSNKKSISPFAHDLITLFPFDLDFELMKKGCQVFCGEHDFVNFQCTGTDVDSTVRKIFSCELVHHHSNGHWGHVIDEYYVLRIIGNGFLKQMVRLMMGAIWNLGRGKITLENLKESLKGGVPLKRLGATAPPEGLYLIEVHY